MPKALPPNDPNFYYHVAEAAYLVKCEAQKYMDRVFGKGVVSVLDQNDVKHHTWWKRIDGTWKMTLFKDTRSGELCIGFEGTNSLRNAIGDVLHHIADPTGLFRDMGAVADKWVKKLTGGRNIWSVVGHSEGGFFATHMKKSWDVYRITFDAHKAERGAKNINLRLHEDPVSGILSVRDRYTTLDTQERGHALEGFKCVQDMKWCDINPREPLWQPTPVLQPQSCSAHDPALTTTSAPNSTSSAPVSASAPNSAPAKRKENEKFVAAAVVVAIPAGAIVGYSVVSATCDVFELEERDKAVTKSSAVAGGVVGTIGTTAAIIGSGATTGLSVTSVAAGAAALGGGSVVWGVCAAFALPAAAAIGAGWIGHKVYQRYHG